MAVNLRAKVSDSLLNNELLMLKSTNNGFISADKRIQLIEKGASQEQLESIENTRQRLLGGGNSFGGSKKLTETMLNFRDNSSLFVRDLSGNGNLVGQLIFPDERTVNLDNIFINGLNVNQMGFSDRDQLIPLLENMEGSLLDYNYDRERNSIFVSSRPSLRNQMIEDTPIQQQMEISTYYSVIEELDEKYVDCVAICNQPGASKQEIKSSVDHFCQTYEKMLKNVRWEEERIDIMIRKATMEGLKINYIPEHRYDLMEKQAKEVIQQFQVIEREIRLLNLSPDAKESLDFHMYRGFVFSKFPPVRYPEQRKIAIADAMIVIHHVVQLEQTGTNQTPAFYKKMASAFTVFAKGVENPPVSLQFISLGLQFIGCYRNLKPGADRSLEIIEMKLLELQQESEMSAVEIELPQFFSSSLSIEDSEEQKVELENIQSTPIENQLEEMDRVDRILFRTFQEYSDPKQMVSNLQRSIGAYGKYIEEELNPAQIFKAKLRSLFLRNYINYLINYGNVSKIKSTFDGIVEELKILAQQVPESEHNICLAELHGFRGCIYIMYPRIRESHETLPYDIAIQDFNELNKMGIHLHDDLKAFQYMIYGQHMLDYDPVKAVQLLRQAITLTHCETVKSNAQKTLKDFFSRFNPIRPSLNFDSKSILKLK